MKLDLLSIELEGFRSFDKTARFDLSARGSGLHRLIGRNDVEPRLGANGAGKTSLWSALTWALYGKTVEGLRGPDITPWNGDKGSFCNVALLIDDQRFDVARTANPNSLTINEKDVDQAEVDLLIGMPIDVFTATILMGQGQPLFFDMRPAEKMELFSAVLELDRWDRRSKAAGTKASDLDRAESKMRGEWNAILREIEATFDLINRTEGNSEDWKTDQLKRTKDIGADIDALKKQADKLQAIVGTSDVAHDGALTEIKGADTEIAKLRREMDGIGAKIEAKERTLGRINGDITRISDAVVGMRYGKACTECGQTIPKDQIKAHVEKLRADLNELEAEAKANSTDVLKADREEVTKEIGRHKDAATKYGKIASEHEAILRIQRPALIEAEAKLSAAEAVLKEKQETLNPYTNQIRDLKKRKIALEKEAAALDATATETTADAERNRYWVKGFKQLKLKLIEDVLDELEMQTNAMLDDMGLVGWEVLFDVEKETKSGTTQRGLIVSVLSPHNKKPVRWESWSGGEGQRLRIVGSLALSDVLLSNAGIEPSFEILDEPTRHLSIEGRRDLCEFLAQRSKAIERQIWLVDHTATEMALFSSSVCVVKDRSGSRIEDDQRPVRKERPVRNK